MKTVQMFLLKLFKAVFIRKKNIVTKNIEMKHLLIVVSFVLQVCLQPGKTKQNHINLLYLYHASKGKISKSRVIALLRHGAG